MFYGAASTLADVTKVLQCFEHARSRFIFVAVALAAAVAVAKAAALQTQYHLFLNPCSHAGMHNQHASINASMLAIAILVKG